MKTQNHANILHVKSRGSTKTFDSLMDAGEALQGVVALSLTQAVATARTHCRAQVDISASAKLLKVSQKVHPCYLQLGKIRSLLRPQHMGNFPLKPPKLLSGSSCSPSQVNWTVKKHSITNFKNVPPLNQIRASRLVWVIWGRRH